MNTPEYARINGLLVLAPDEAVCYKYSDPTEGARWVYRLEDRREIERQDQALIAEIHGMASCHGCGDDVFGGDAHWDNGEPYCEECSDDED